MDIRIVNLRAIAILIVVLGHSIILYDPSWGLYHSEVVMPMFELIKRYLINPIQMPIFFFISGFLFYRSINKTVSPSFGKFFRSKFLRLIVPYFCIAMLWMNPIKWLVRAPGYENFSDCLTILKYQFLFSGSLGHLWYLPTLFGVFLIVFLCLLWFNSIPECRSRKFLHVSLFILFLLSHYLSAYFPSYFCLSSIAYYLIFFFVGYLLSYNISCVNLLCSSFTNIRWIGYVCWLIFLFCACHFTHLRAIFVILFVSISYLLIPDKTNKFIRSISDNSFGIYLFHSPLIYITYAYYTNSNPWLVLFLNFIVMGTISYLLTYYISKTKLKFIIGGNR